MLLRDERSCQAYCFSMVVDLFRSRAAIEAEILMLRQQINVLRRSAPKKQTFSSIDRLIFVCLYRLLPGVRDALERFAHAMRLSPLDPRVMVIRNGTAYAHFLLGHYDEAASWAVMALQGNPDFLPGLRIAAASNAMAGRPEQAHKAVARLRHLNPALRVSPLKDMMGPWRAEDLSRLEEGLRRAGLPE